MTTVLAARPGDDAARILERAEALDQRLWHLPAAWPQVGDARHTLHARGVTITSLATTPAGLDDALRCGSALRVRAVVVEPGARGDADPEDATDRLVRLLHAPLVAGAPLVLRNGAGPDDLLGFIETEWLLSELPRLALWFDAAHALALHRAEGGPDVATWLDTYGDRLGGLFVHGLGRDGRGGAHPDDDGPDWPALDGALARAAPRVLAMDPSHDEDAIREGARYVRGL